MQNVERAERHIQRGLDLMSFGAQNCAPAHLRPSKHLNQDHCSERSVLQCMSNCGLISVLSLLLKLPGLFDMFSDDIQAWLLGAQTSMKGDFRTCKRLPASVLATYHDLLRRTWKFVDMNGVRVYTDRDRTLTAVVASGTNGHLMLEAVLMKLPVNVVSFSSLCTTTIDKVFLDTLTQEVLTHRHSPVNMVDITITDCSRYRYSPFRKAYQYLFERPVKLHDIQDHLLIIHDTLQLYNFTLRGGIVSYDMARRRRRVPVTHSQSLHHVDEPRSHAAIDEGGHSVSFTMCPDREGKPQPLICSWGECSRDTAFLNITSTPETTFFEPGLVKGMCLVLYSVDEFSDA